MKKEKMILLAACIAMTAAASAQQAAVSQKVTVRSGGEVKAGKEKTVVKTDVDAAHAGKQTVKLEEGEQASSAGKTEARASAAVDAKPVVVEVRKAQAGAGEAVNTVKEEIRGKVKETGDEVKETVRKTEAQAAVVTEVGAEAAAGIQGDLPAGITEGDLKGVSEGGTAVNSELRSALQTDVSFLGAVPGEPVQLGDVLPKAGEVPVKTTAATKSLVNGSLKSTRPVKLHAAGTIGNTLKINAVPIRAQVRSLTAGGIGIF